MSPNGSTDDQRSELQRVLGLRAPSGTQGAPRGASAGTPTSVLPGMGKPAAPQPRSQPCREQLPPQQPGQTDQPPPFRLREPWELPGTVITPDGDDDDTFVAPAFKGPVFDGPPYSGGGASRSPGGPPLGSYDSRHAALNPRKRRRPLRFALPALLLTATGFAVVRLLGLHMGMLFPAHTGQNPRPSSPGSAFSGGAGPGGRASADAGMTALASFAGYPGQGGRNGGALAVNALAANGGQAIAVGSADGYPAIWRQGPEASWALTGTGGNGALTGRPGDQALTAVTGGPAGWLAVGNVVSGAQQHPVVVTSADGQTWQAADGAAPFQGPGLFASGATAGRFDYVIVGEQVTGNSVTAATWSSAGLGTWTRGTTAATGTTTTGVAGKPSGMFAVTVGPGQFVAVGEDGSQPAVWTSGNGQSWTAADLALPGGAAKAALREVAGSGKHLVATGIAQTRTGPAAFAEVSADGGATWRENALPSGGTAVSAVTAVGVSGSGFVAAGQAGPADDPYAVVWRSADGTTWTSAAAVPGPAGGKVRAITSLAPDGGAARGIGLATTKAGASPVLYSAP